MSERPRVSIVIPYFNTPRLMKVCLRALRCYAPGSVEAEVVVVNNGTTDGSDAYLRSLPWIRLVDRRLERDETEDGPRVGLSHGRAINFAWRLTDAPYFLAIHSDTIVKQDGWLDFLLGHLRSRPRAFGAGSWKMEIHSPLRASLKVAGDYLSVFVSRRARERLRSREQPFLRSHCALYRRKHIEREGLLPFDDGATTCGQGIHYAMEDRGYEAVFIPARQLIPHVEHINHGTMVLNPALGASARSVRKGERRLAAFYSQLWVRRLEEDDSLDR